MIPYLFKEIVFFYYILLKVASANTMNAKLIQSISSKCWTLRFSENNSSNKVKLDDYVLIHLDAHSIPIVFKVGTVAVQRDTYSYVSRYYILLHICTYTIACACIVRTHIECRR